MSEKERMIQVQDLGGKVARQMSATLLGYGIDPEHYAQVVVEGILRTPEIMRCSDRSLARAFRQACTQGLVPDGRQAVILPYKDQAQFVPMKLGLELAVHEITRGLVRSGVVREQDSFEFVEDSSGTTFRHERCLRPEKGQSNEIVGAWACLDMVEPQRTLVRVLDRSELDQARDRSPSQNGPWRSFFGAMCEKTAVKQVLSRNEYLIQAAIGQDTSKRARLAAVMSQDQEDAAIDVTDDGAVEHQVAPEVEPETRQRRAPAKRRGRPPQAAAAPEPAPEPEPVLEPESEIFDEDPSAGVGTEIGGADDESLVDESENSL